MKYANLLAAAVLAVGVNAQAADQTSATYCVITLPVAVGYNLYGVAVNPETGATYADTFGVDETTSFVNTVGAGSSIDGDATAVQLTALWHSSEAAGNLYQFGIDDSATDTYTFVPGATVSAVFKKPLTLADFTAFQESSNKVYSTTKSNIVSIWDAANQKYVRYYYKQGTGWRINGSNASITASEVTIPVGSAVFIHPSVNFKENVSFTF